MTMDFRVVIDLTDRVTDKMLAHSIALDEL